MFLKMFQNFEVRDSQGEWQSCPASFIEYYTDYNTMLRAPFPALERPVLWSHLTCAHIRDMVPECLVMEYAFRKKRYSFLFSKGSSFICNTAQKHCQQTFSTWEQYLVVHPIPAELGPGLLVFLFALGLVTVYFCIATIKSPLVKSWFF